MARVTPHSTNAPRISPEISDDEVFDSVKVWKPRRANGQFSDFPMKVPVQQVQQPFHNVQLHDCSDAGGLDWDESGQHPCSESGKQLDREESAWTDPVSSWDCSGNTNNNSPGAFCSVARSESRVDDGHCQPWSDFKDPESFELQCRRVQMHQLERRQSIVDGLLFDIYDRWHGPGRRDSFDSDTVTECSSTSEVFHSRWDSYYETAAEQHHSKQFHRSFLESQSPAQVKRIVSDLQRSVGQVSTRLVRQLKRRDRQLAKFSRNCDVVTAILQAASLKRQIDTRMKFSLVPPPGQSAFDQWKDAMKAVNRLPMGIPPEFRKKVWLSLADNYIRKLKIDWHKTVRLAFNERSNPDDDKLGMQIVKDLHRTGCSSFSGQDNEEDRAVLKRVLLAYARWNKRIGYCQGFNVIAALLLNVMQRKEDDALKVMIYLIDSVLPESYFDNNLRALSVDMAVFRDLLRMALPTLSRHLDRLQHAAQDLNTGACYEPPLTNVFTMQWFLTLFATCLPKEVVLRVWDAILLEGSEVLLRTALCLWGKQARRIMKVDSADEFYSLMGQLSSDMMEGTIFNGDEIIKAIYAVAPFPFPQLSELREKYTYNIRPFSSAQAPSGKAWRMAKAVLYSDEDELDEEELRAITSFSGFGKGKGTDISLVGPGAYGPECDVGVGGGRDSVYLERMSTDITALKMQYDKLRLRQRQAHVIIAGSGKKTVPVKQKAQAPVLMPKIETPLAMNHLFVGKVQGGRNRLVTKGPRIAAATLPHFQPQATLQAAASTPAKPLSPSPPPDAKPAFREGAGDQNSSQLLPLHSFNRSVSSSNIGSGDATLLTPDCKAALSASADEIHRERDLGDVERVCAFPSHAMSAPCLKDADANDEGVGVVGEERGVDPSPPDPSLFTFAAGSDDEDVFDAHDWAVKEADSGVALSTSDASCEPSPEKKAPRPISLQVQDTTAQANTQATSQQGKNCREDAPIGTSPTHLVPAKSPPPVASKEPAFVSTSSLTSPSHPPQPLISPGKTSRPFNPFPVKHVNTNRAKTGLKLGLYTPSTVEYILGKKARNPSS